MVAEKTSPKQQEAQDAEEEKIVEDATGLAPKLIYEVIRREGEEELARTKRSLFWSGIAAGIMISFSVVGEAVFRTYLPVAQWSYLVENIGYSLGFLLVIMGRMQLFTENTITTVLPLMVTPTPRMYWAVARLWAIVLGANVIGAFAIATLYAHTPVLPGDLIPAMMSLSEHAVGMGAADSFWRGIPAGILVAAIVWMIPQAQTSAFFVVLLFTWMIAAGDFTHIVAGSVEMAFLMVQGELGLGPALFGFFLPVLAGNVVGGTVIFTLMAWGQVRDDIVKDGS
ncbi:formate/nitrite transporter family protein [Ovoidimarina sediminis]|uniref:formate/nitrite transporter family protein n=1 Tax=Ovoidimarina sediminis TaxID=3079856 RepID=UPI00290F10F4|nr:formate/nitrite transporter family protein [Rhodophyticola sp. MJ-SS7]MDU8943354.1 formate/nitrite transporter family protein [Rhodophyticola sp. MJ-SS7]